MRYTNKDQRALIFGLLVGSTALNQEISDASGLRIRQIQRYRQYYTVIESPFLPSRRSLNTLKLALWAVEVGLTASISSILAVS